MTAWVLIAPIAVLCCGLAVAASALPCFPELWFKGSALTANEMSLGRNAQAVGITAAAVIASACGTGPVTGRSLPDGGGATIFGVGIVGSGDSVDGATDGSFAGDASSDDGDDSARGAAGGGSLTDSGAADGPGPSDSSTTDGDGTDGSASDSSDDGSVSDSSSDGASVTIGLGVHFKSLNWSITGPHNYSGSVDFGDARSIEFVAGGIEAGSGYTLTLSGIDTNNDSCSGTSNPFNVQAGSTSNVTIVLICMRPSEGAMAADVTTGSVRVEAGVASNP